MIPNPGSKEAQEAGCTCPIIDNRYGKGFYMSDNEPVFVINCDCPIHGGPNDRKEN